jgi:hypothetical protein
MSRNFGFRPPIRNNRPPIWPMWAVAFLAIGMMNAAVFLHNR